MKIVCSKEYESQINEINQVVQNFNAGGNILFKGRNKIKVFSINGLNINVKSFRVPNILNRFVYKLFRKSKAERSYIHAKKLRKKNIGTPAPIAYFEEENNFSFGRSYYISQQVSYDLTYRELVTNPDFPDHEQILRAFTRFTWQLHEQHILFLDHSPGNTLIQVKDGNINFFLVDLNRMVFKQLNTVERLKNFSRLTPKKEMVAIMADEYAQLIKRPQSEVFERMWFYTHSFQKKFYRKKQFKKKFKL